MQDCTSISTVSFSNKAIHDLSGQLTGSEYCFELLSLQNLNSKAQEYLNTGKKQCQTQETLIREILDAFATEIASLEGADIAPRSGSAY